MASANYVLIEKISVGAAGASSVTFNSIPQTGYTDLVIKCSVRNTANVDWTGVYFNGVTTGYSNRAIQGTGAAASSRNSTDKDLTILTDENAFTASTFGNAEVYIPNYTSANYKSYSVDTVTENNATTAYSELSAQLWSNTAAITSITLNAQSSSLAQYSTFYLYGVAKLGTTPAIVPYATGGDIVMTDGTYWYHTFLSSGTFTPAVALSCDYLVVAGGGSGLGRGSRGGGGGGAGGLRSTVTATGGGGSLESKLSVTSGTGYTVTVGAGGAGASSPTGGSDSVFATITSIGGGAGSYSGGGGTGGSGGGGDGTGTAGGAGTTNQGYAGASGGGAYWAGGGGGAGQLGQAGNSSTGGNGGAGVATVISGSSVTYAGGGGGGGTGGGGTGGTGGGGAGSNSTNGTAGTANTGGGGGGSGSGTDFLNSKGGSGIVIIRYTVAS